MTQSHFAIIEIILLSDFNYYFHTVILCTKEETSHNFCIDYQVVVVAANLLILLVFLS